MSAKPEQGRNRLLWLLILTATLLAQPGKGAAQCFYLEPVKPNDPFQFGKALIQSFSYAQAGLDNEAEAPGRSEFASAKNVGEISVRVSDRLYAMKLANNDYGCAAKVLAEYVVSEDKFISGTAEAAVTSYISIIVANEAGMKHLTELLDSAGSESPGATAETAAELRLQYDKSWKLLVHSVGPMSTYSFMKFSEDKSVGWDGRLRITSEQRKVLIENLEQTFGSSVKGGIKAGQDSLLGTAALFHQWLSNKKHKSLDEN